MFIIVFRDKAMSFEAKLKYINNKSSGFIKIIYLYFNAVGEREGDTQRDRKTEEDKHDLRRR